MQLAIYAILTINIAFVIYFIALSRKVNDNASDSDVNIFDTISEIVSDTVISTVTDVEFLKNIQEILAQIFSNILSSNPLTSIMVNNDVEIDEETLKDNTSNALVNMINSSNPIMAQALNMAFGEEWTEAVKTNPQMVMAIMTRLDQMGVTKMFDKLDVTVPIKGTSKASSSGF